MRLRTIVLAPDSFKGTLSAHECARAMEQGARDAMEGLTCILHPLSDGGEGLVKVLIGAMGGEIVHSRVAGPLRGQEVEAAWGWVPEQSLAVIETAEAAGLHLVPERMRDPRLTTTFGVGELVRHALDRGAARILLGVGGTATNDGGAGLGEALGIRFYDRDGKTLERGGGALLNLSRVDLSGRDPRLKSVSVTVACDVQNPLLGSSGAAAVYAPQKGAAATDVALLEIALRRFADVIESASGVSIRNVAGAGAAGGLGGGLMAMLGATLERGIELALELTAFDEHLRDADLVITGEGRLDRQSTSGKVLSGVLDHARTAGIPVAAVVGSVAGTTRDYTGAGDLIDIAVLADEATPPELAWADAARLVGVRTRELVTRLGGS